MKKNGLKYKKTPQSKRGTYKLFDNNGDFVTEFIPNKDGVTNIDIINLHKLDDHEVYSNCKEIKLPEWYQPIYDEWKESFIADFKEKYGREPLDDEIPSKHRTFESIDVQEDSNGEDLGESSHLAEELAIYDEEDVTDAVFRLREVIANMPEQWQKIYRLVFIKELSKSETGRIIGISDVRVCQLVKKIKDFIANDKILKNFFE